MIVKELDPLPTSVSSQVQAGRRAEEQMAFYLRRAFAEDPAINVLNGLRVERQNEVAQIDHLLISTHGFILIESKSVTTKVQVNEQGEWSRQIGADWRGMPSPVLQVERQADLLRALLNDHVDLFYRKLLTLQWTFTSVPFDGLVAISDTGVIQRPPGFATQQVLKADQITSRIQELNADYRRASSLFSLSLKHPGAEWSAKTVANLTEFLLEQHRPYPQSTSTFIPAKPLSSPERSRPASRAQLVPPGPKLQPALANESQPMPDHSLPSQKSPPSHTCRACGSQQLTILYGKYGYYFKCASCHGNTPIKVTGADGKVAKLSKRGREFYVVGSDGAALRLFYTNPPD